MQRSTSRAPALRTLCCAAILALFAPSAPAVNYSWDRGAGTNFWADANNWNPNAVPDFLDSLILSSASLAGPQTIDLAGTRSISSISLTTVTGAYTFTNSSPGGALEIFGAAEGSLIIAASPTASLIFDTDVRYRVAGRMYINGDPDGAKVTFNAGRTLTSAASSGTSTFNFTSQNTALDYAIEVHSVTADGPSARVAVEAGWVGDAVNIGRVLLDGLNTYTGPTSVNGMTLAFNSIGNYGPGAAASALGAPTTLADGTINLGANAAAPNNVRGTLRYVGTAPAGHSSNRPFQFVGFSSGGIIEASGAGPLVLSGGLTSTSSGTVNRTLTLGGANTGDNIFSGVIADVPGTAVQHLIKNGPGKWSLTAANTYLGATTIDAGTLVVGPGGAIGAGGAAGRVAINGTAILRLDGGSIATTEIDRADSASFEFRSGTLSVSGAAGSGILGVQLLDIGSAGAGTLNLSGGAFTANSVKINGPDDALNITGGTFSATSLDNADGGTLALPAAGTLDVRSAGGALTTGAGSIAGAVTGAGGLTKVGPGILQVTSSLAYTGTTTVNQGTLRLSGAGRLANLSPLIINAPAIVELDAVPDEVFSLNGNGTANLLNGSLLAVGGLGNAGGTGTFSGVIQGDGAFDKRGSGTLLLTGNNTYLGTTAVQEGTLAFNSIANLGDTSALGAPVTAVNGTIALSSTSRTGTLRYVGTAPGGHSTNRQIGIVGATSTGVIDASGSGPLTITGGTQTDISTTPRTLIFSGTNTGDNTFGGGIAAGVGTGALNVVKSGTGRWVLTAANTYEGSTAVNAGELVVRGPSGTITGGGLITVAGTGILTLDGGTITTPDLDVGLSANFLLRSGTLTLGNGSQTIPQGNLAIGTNGPGTMTVTASVGTNNFGTLIVHGPDDMLTISGGSNQLTAIDNSHGGTFNFTGGIVILIGGPITTASGTLAGSISSTQFGVTKIGPGTLNMGAGITNFYAGATNINEGTLKILGTGNQLSDSTRVNIAAGATLDLVGSDGEDFGSLVGAGTVIVGPGGARVGPGQANQSFTFNGNITGNGDLAKFGTGTFALEGPSDYAGATSVVAGTLAIRGSGAITNTSTVIVAAGTTLRLGDATIGPGVITTGTLDNDNAGTLDWINGTLRIKAAGGIALGTGLALNKPLGASYNLSAGRILQIDTTTTIEATGSLTLNGGTLITGQLANTTAGAFNFDSGLLWFTQNQSFTEAFASQVDVDAPLGAGRRVRVDGTASIFAPITIAGGNFTADAIVNPHNLILDRGTLVVSSPLVISPGTSVDASTGMTINAAGGLQVPATAQFNAIGATLNATAASNNAGDINAINSTLTFTGGLTSPGRLRLIDTTVNGPVNLPGAAVEVAGNATFNGPVSGAAPFAGSSSTVTFNGGYAPGNSAAAVSFDGSLVLGDDNALRIEIGGTTRGTQYDAIDVAGSATLDGTLNVTLINGFAPRTLDSFDVIRFAGAAGSFDAYTGMDIPGRLALAPLREADRFRLVATLPGDANVDGAVDFNDLAALAQNYNKTDGTRTWPDGDFTYDGDVDFDDLAALAQNYNSSALPAPGALSSAFEGEWQRALEQAAAVPEPAAIIILVGATLIRTSRQRSPFRRI